MRLSKIKMSGFKSFVDPTTIMLPSNLIAVVGPNGCGKSNIIDAVTWVMGESSPKYLRGEALTDVIFNGSTARKPVGQSAVELIFDNSDGTIGGEYAKFSEISVKRMINRDSDSTYYLNNVRCRKRDIVDIFLGTGLGPRSYSIIGQNMISRIIEAKPEELRTYLEEAAGISKYKERRHETELRINHTKDNLARVNDVCAELDKQLNHLKHQANVAEKYKSLKQQERVLKAEWYGIQWRELDARIVDHTLKIQREETALEARNSELVRVDKDMEHLRHEQRVAHDAFQEVQRRYYAISNEITRIEQEIVHHQERQQQWQNDLKQVDHDYETVQQLMMETEEALQAAEHDLFALEPQIHSVKQELAAVQDDYEQAEEALQNWQTEWDEFNRVSSQTAQTAQVEKTHIQHLEQRYQALENRLMQLRQEQSAYDVSELSVDIQSKHDAAKLAEEQLYTRESQLTETRESIHDLRTELQQSHQALDKVRSRLQQSKGQQASLQALQQTALGQRDNPTTPWLSKHQLDQHARLAQYIQVEDGWDVAAEKVLGMYLQAICVEQIAEVLPHVDSFKQGNLFIYSKSQGASSTSPGSNKAVLLRDKIKSSLPIDSLLNGIYVADTLEQATSLCEKLEAHESIITRDGVWMGRSWLKLLREQDPAAGVFQREQALRQLQDQIDELHEQQQELEGRITQQKDRLQQLENQFEQLQQKYKQEQTLVSELNAQHKMQQERYSQRQAQSEKNKQEQQDCENQIASVSADLTNAKSIWEQALSELEQQALQKDQLLARRDQVRICVQQMREAINQKKERFHELEVRLQTTRSQKGSHQQAISRLQLQVTSLHDRKITLQGELTSMQPIDVIQKSLNRSLDKHVSVEAELNLARVATEALDQENRNLEEKRQIVDRESNRIRSALETLRVEWQGWRVKAETILEQFKETQFTLEDILKDLPQDVTAGEWQTKLEQVANRITRLGPINLVAIDEYTACLERKQYLDEQLKDLNDGLATLEDAIAKIDKETRARFKETFDKVNSRFQELFPTVFGGGKAYLELTSDNLLDAGVTLMACPPGKRNSSIYLLSGGEKSLTAIALIFSIFYLNPAPFCLLDEVDAALDDANVLRFTKLVKIMSEKTQFIFISHNKITIEMGQHLMGVTMNEPGVSRLVSVDIDKAISMVESSD